MGMFLREVRSTPTAADVRSARDGEQQPSHTSIGRLLRLIADPRCLEHHVAIAIENVDAAQSHDGSGSSGHKHKRRPMPSLSDHRHVSNIETVLKMLDTHELADHTQATTTSVAQRNLVRAIASAMVAQSVELCSSTKTNVCVWTQESRKRLKLLEWMLRCSEAHASVVLCDVLLQDLVSQDKSTQMTACLVVFELAQRTRQSQVQQKKTLPPHWPSLIAPLVKVVAAGSVQTKSVTKPTKLGAVALDALIGLLCVAGMVPTVDGKCVLDGIKEALSTWTKWYGGSPKREFLALAAHQLGDLIESVGAVDMVAWHWNATAMWLCSRSTCVLSVSKSRLPECAQKAVHDLHRLARRPTSAQHLLSAKLRHLCVFFHHFPGGPDSIKRFLHRDSITATGTLLIALAKASLRTVTGRLAPGLLRRLIVENLSQPIISLSEGEQLAYFGLYLTLVSGSVRHVGTYVVDLLAELSCSIGAASLDPIGRWIQSSTEPTIVELPLSVLARALEISAVSSSSIDQKTLYSRVATTIVISILNHHPVKSIRSKAVPLLPRLDLHTSMRFAASLVKRVDTSSSGVIVTLLFSSVDGDAAKTSTLAHGLIDGLAHSPIEAASVITTPAELGSSRPPQVISEQPQQDTEQRQRHALTQSLGGWCLQASPMVREAVLRVLILKVFGCPREASWLTWLRELSLIGWFDDSFKTVLTHVVEHMEHLERLTDALLEDVSPRAANAVETLLFARLAPNLVLRVTPRHAFISLYRQQPTPLIVPTQSVATGDVLVRLTHQLWGQVLDPLEYKEVKMLAVELLTKLPIHEVLPAVILQVGAFLRAQHVPTTVVSALTSSKPVPIQGDDFVAAKLMMYYMNRVVMDQSAQELSQPAIEGVLCSLLTVLSLPVDSTQTFSPQASPLVDLQMGAIECLAVLMAQQSLDGSNQWETIATSIVDVIMQRSSVSGHFSAWQTALRETDEGGGVVSMDQLRLCACNVVLSALSKLDTDMVPRFQECVHELLGCLETTDTPAPMLAASMQIAFAYLFKAGQTLDSSDPRAQKLCSLCIALVKLTLRGHHQTTSDQVYLSTLKLLGALIGRVPWLWGTMPQTDHEAIANGLQQLRDRSTTAPSVRQLAQSLLEAILS